jgi:hypothetical protein
VWCNRTIQKLDENIDPMWCDVKQCKRNPTLNPKSKKIDVFLAHPQIKLPSHELNFEKPSLYRGDIIWIYDYNLEVMEISPFSSI